MSHIIRGRLDRETAPADAAEKYDEILEEYRPILDNPVFDKFTERWDGERPAYIELEVRLDVRDDPDRLVRDLEDIFDGAEWLVIHTRADDSETDVEEFRDDPAYYDPNLDNGLRAPVVIDRTARFEIEIDQVYAVIAGDEVETGGETLEIDRPESGRERNSLYLSSDGTISRNDGFRIADVEVHAGKIVSIEPRAFTLPSGEFGDPDVVRGDPPEPFVDDSENFPPEPSNEERLRKLEASTGTGRDPSRGISQRLDDLEDRVEALED